jgi:hypothetical protein
MEYRNASFENKKGNTGTDPFQDLAVPISSLIHTRIGSPWQVADPVLLQTD